MSRWVRGRFWIVWISWRNVIRGDFRALCARTAGAELPGSAT